MLKLIDYTDLWLHQRDDRPVEKEQTHTGKRSQGWH